MFESINFKKFDIVLLLEVAALNAIGIMAIGSAQSDLQPRQLMGSLIGIVIMLIVSLIDHRKVLRFAWYLYAVNIILLLLVLLIGTNEGGAQRWVSLGPVSFQPSELAKLLLILFYAKFIVIYRNKLELKKYLGYSIAAVLVPLFLILMEPDLSSSIVIFLIFCTVIFVGGINWKLVAAILTVTIPSAIIMLNLIISDHMPLIRDYQRERILAWLHPEEYASTTAYQTMNSIMAIGSGQIFGKGFRSNAFGSLLESGFISESQTDFIFTVIGEEFGFIGTILTVVLLALIVHRIYKIGLECRQTSGKIIASGMAAWIGFQSFLNVSVTTGILPNTGIPLPFVSYGLTSLVCLYSGLGFVMNVKMLEAEPKRKKKSRRAKAAVINQKRLPENEEPRVRRKRLEETPLRSGIKAPVYTDKISNTGIGNRREVPVNTAGNIDTVNRRRASVNRDRAANAADRSRREVPVNREINTDTVNRRRASVNRVRTSDTVSRVRREVPVNKKLNKDTVNRERNNDTAVIRNSRKNKSQRKNTDRTAGAKRRYSKTTSGKRAK